MSAPVALQITAGFLMFLVVFAPLERWIPARPQRALRPGWTTDIAYYVMGGLLDHASDYASMAAMFVIRGLAGLDAERGAAMQPGWLQFLEILILADLLSYVLHRALHRVPWLWRLHVIHHSSKRMDWLANVRMHPIDRVLGDMVVFVPVFAMGFSQGPLIVYAVFLGFQGFLNHANVNLDYGPLRWILASPQSHHWHHSSDPAAYNKNFASNLVLIDVLLGTAHIAPRRAMPEHYGVQESVPDGFWAQLAHPFRARSTTSSTLERQPGPELP